MRVKRWFRKLRDDTVEVCVIVIKHPIIMGTHTSISLPSRPGPF